MRKISFCPGILYIYALIILFIVAGVVILVRIFFPNVWTIILIIMLIFYFFVVGVSKNGLELLSLIYKQNIIVYRGAIFFKKYKVEPETKVYVIKFMCYKLLNTRDDGARVNDQTPMMYFDVFIMSKDVKEDLRIFFERDNFGNIKKNKDNYIKSLKIFNRSRYYLYRATKSNYAHLRTLIKKEQFIAENEELQKMIDGFEEKLTEKHKAQ